MDKVSKHCSNCQTKYTIEWDEDKYDLPPLTCPFCGYEVEDEADEVEWINKDVEDEDNSWN